MTLTKADLIDSIGNQLELPVLSRSKIIETTLEIIKSTLESGEAVLVSGFGRFYIKEKSTRRGRNPVTGEDLMLDARRVVLFKCAGVLREKINNEK